MLRLILVSLLAALGSLAQGAAGAGGERSASVPTPRRGEILHLLRHDCGSCHGLTLKGGLGPPLLPGALAGQPDQSLVDAILDGRRGTPMAPWRFELSRDEAAWLVDVLRQGAAHDR